MASKTKGNAKAAASKAAKESSAAKAKQQAADSSALASMNKLRASQGAAAQTSIGVKAPSSSSSKTSTPVATVSPVTKPATPPQGSSGQKILNPTQLKQYTDAGLTENDIVRQGSEIYFRAGVTPETLATRKTTVPTPTATQTGAFDPSKAGQKILNVADLNSYAKMGLTESDIVRDGKDIYFKNGITPETLQARTAGDVPFVAAPPAVGENLSPDTLETPSDTSLLTGWDLDTSSPAAFAKSIEALFEVFKSEQQKLLEQKQKDATAKLEGLVDDLGEKKDRYDSLNDKYNVDSQYKQLMELNLLMAQKQGEYMQLAVDTEGQTISTGLLIGQGAQVQRQMAADMGILGARAAALTGNIELANTLVDRALDVEFGSIQDQINATSTLLSTYGDQLSTEEAAQATKVGLVLDERQKILDEEKEQKKQKLQLMLDVAAAGGDVKVIDLQKSLEENIRAAAPYLETASEDGAATEAQILSAAQTLVNSGLADNMTDAIAQVRSGLAAERYSGLDSTGMTGTAAWDDWLSSTGNGTITSHPGDDMGDLYGGGHMGFDIDGNTGDDVVAPVSGTVIEAVNDKGSSTSGYGNYIKVQDDNGNVWTFGHFQNVSVQQGQTISVGDYIGAMGKSGNTSGKDSSDPNKGSHLHVEVSGADGQQLDPSELLTGEMKQDESLKAYQDAFNNIKLELTDADTKLAQREFNNYLRDGDFEGAKEYMKAVIFSGSGQGTKDKLTARASTAAALASIKAHLDAYVQNGGDTNIFKGSIENIAKAVGNTSDPELRALGTQIQYAIINYRSFVSGAAFTESEGLAYERLFPSIGNVPAVNTAVIDSLISSFDQSTESYYRQRMGSTNYDRIFEEGDFSVAARVDGALANQSTEEPNMSAETDDAATSYVDSYMNSGSGGLLNMFLDLFK